jgi:hypothetical protein
MQENRSRLRLTAGITVPSLASQTSRDWSWVVLLHTLDPLLQARMAVCARVGVPVRYLFTDDASMDRRRAAARAYKAPWDEAIDASVGVVLTTRLDDDDAFVPDMLARVRRYARNLSGRCALIAPLGWRVWDGKYAHVRADANAWATLRTEHGDPLTVYGYGHTKVHDIAPVTQIPGRRWLWVRHAHTLSRHRVARRPIDDRLRSRFPTLRWELLE